MDDHLWELRLLLVVAEYLARCSHPQTRSVRFSDRTPGRARICVRCGAFAYVKDRTVGRWTRPALVTSIAAFVGDYQKGRIAGGTERAPISGPDFVTAIHAAIPDAFSDLDDVLPGDAPASREGGR